jgi:phage tail protein X
MEYITQEGDTVANIAWLRYGTSAGHTERILTENYGLAAYPALLPAGIKIRLHEAAKNEEIQEKSTLNLWD